MASGGWFEESTGCSAILLDTETNNWTCIFRDPRDKRACGTLVSQGQGNANKVINHCKGNFENCHVQIRNYLGKLLISEIVS